MGWWSEDILGGDTPLDMMSGIEEALGIRGYNNGRNGGLYPVDDIEKGLKTAAREAINSKTTQEVFEGVLSQNWFSAEDDEDCIIFDQVFAVIVMAVGADMSKEDKARFVASSYDPDLDGWGGNKDKRQAALDNLKEAIEAYDGTPIVINSKGLLQAACEAMDDEDD